MRNRFNEIFAAVKTKNMQIGSMQGLNQILLFSVHHVNDGTFLYQISSNFFPMLHNLPIMPS